LKLKTKNSLHKKSLPAVLSYLKTSSRRLPGHKVTEAVITVLHTLTTLNVSKQKTLVKLQVLKLNVLSTKPTAAALALWC